jgi:hypothetical protein
MLMRSSTNTKMRKLKALSTKEGPKSSLATV